MTDKVLSILKEEFNRRLKLESLSRIEKCISHLTSEEIWRKNNENTNSIGNLILHLQGNVEQYISSGIGGEKDVRQRNKEFDSIEKIDKETLVKRLRQTVELADEIVSKLQFDDLAEKKQVQGFEESVLSIIIHVIEHFSYHTGQITYYTKYIKNIDTGYYAGLDLDVIN